MAIAALAGWHATAFRDRFGEPVDVMGISAGGVTALQLELDHPGTVRRLVLCSAASRVGPQGLGELQRLIEAEGQGRSSARIGSGLIAHGPLRLLLLAAFGLARGQIRAPGEAMLVQAAQSWDVTGRLGEIGVPVLVAGGTRDRVVPPELLQATASGIAGARLLLLPGRGHLTALYDPRLKPAIAASWAPPTSSRNAKWERVRSRDHTAPIGVRCGVASTASGTTRLQPNGIPRRLYWLRPGAFSHTERLVGPEVVQVREGRPRWPRGSGPGWPYGWEPPWGSSG
jgi:hypothetical protein